MAYMEYKYDDLPHLPDDAQCIIASSHVAKKDKSKSYLGGSGTNEGQSNPTANITIFTKTDEEAQEFFKWFKDDLDGGTKKFTAVHELFGFREYYVFEISDGISENIIGGDNRKISFNAEVVGVSFPNFTPVSAEVTEEGIIEIIITPESNDRTFNSTYYQVTVGDTVFSSSSAIMTGNLLTIEITEPINDYPNVSIEHTTEEHGLQTFTINATNNSLLSRAEVVTGQGFANNNGNEIFITLDKAVVGKSWSNSDNPFTVYADGENVLLSTTQNCSVTDDVLYIYLNNSRPVYSGEYVTVDFNNSDDICIAPFSDFVLSNTSNVVNHDAMTVIQQNINLDGNTITLHMSRVLESNEVFNVDNFSVSLNGTEYDCSAVTTLDSRILVTMPFNITTYVTSLSIIHSAKEYGFGIDTLTVTNISTVDRLDGVSGYTSQDGLDVYAKLSAYTTWAVTSYVFESTDVTITSTGNTLTISTLIVPKIVVIEGEDYIYARVHSDTPISDGETVLFSFLPTTNLEIADFADLSITNNSVITNQSVSSAEVNTDGDILTVTMSDSYTATYTPEYFIVNGGYIEFVADEATQSTTVLTLDLTQANGNVIRDNVTVTLEHISADQTIPVFSDIAVTNSSTVVPPEYSSAEVISSGTYIILTLDENLTDDKTWDATDFTVTVDAVGRDVSQDVIGVVGSHELVIHLSILVGVGDVVTLAFTPTDDPQIEAFSETITNNSTGLAELVEYDFDDLT